MLSGRYSVQNPTGLHARPCATLLKLAQEHGCVLYVRPKPDEAWQEASLMNLMLMGAGQGAVLELAADNGNPEVCLEAIRVFLENRKEV